MSELPLLSGLRNTESLLNVKDFCGLFLPSKSPYGNLMLSWTELILRVEHINDLSITIKNDFEELNLNKSVDITKLYSRLKFNSEQVIYWLRKTTDELISILYILSYFKENGKYPEKIKISSIGELLNSNNNLSEKLASQKEYLELINNISNTYKHSIINSQTYNHFRNDSLFVIAYQLKFNNLKSPPKLHTVEFRAILLMFQEFLEEIKKNIKSLSVV